MKTYEATGEESEFSWAMSRYYNDTVACMGALQIAPVLLHSLVFSGYCPYSPTKEHRFVHSAITKKGRSLKVLFERLHRAASPTEAGWDENETLKSVRFASYQLRDFPN